MEETDNRLEEAERRAKASAARALARGEDNAAGILREEEGLFLDLEAARDELAAEKTARRDLEAEVTACAFVDASVACVCVVGVAYVSQSVHVCASVRVEALN